MNCAGSGVFGRSPGPSVAQGLSAQAKEAAGHICWNTVCVVCTAFSGNPECCQALKERTLARCEAAVSSEARGAQRQLVLDVSMPDSALFHLFPSLPPSHSPLSLPIHYHLPVNPQTALLQSQPNDQLENSTSCNQNSLDALKLCINSFRFQQSPIQRSGEGKRSEVFSEAVRSGNVCSPCMR